jgi:hypothetical protein
MSNVSLLNSAGNRKVSNILRLVFPNRIRGYFLTRSYTDGTAVPASNIDVDILFIESFISREENDRAQ